MERKGENFEKRERREEFEVL
jgi:hypothetical protein